MSRKYALDPATQAKMDALLVRHNELSLKSSFSEEESAELEELKPINDVAKALLQIDTDLQMFKDHIEGDDEALKETALIFKKEFQQCKDDLESQLNKLLE